MRKELIKIPFLKLYSPLFYFNEGEQSLIIRPKNFPSSIFNVFLYSKDRKLQSVKHLSFLNNQDTEKINIRGYDALRIARPTWGFACTAELILSAESPD